MEKMVTAWVMMEVYKDLNYTICMGTLNKNLFVLV